MSQLCSAFPFSQKNSLNTLEAMESHLEAELKDGLGLPGSVVQSLRMGWEMDYPMSQQDFTHN